MKQVDMTMDYVESVAIKHTIIIDDPEQVFDNLSNYSFRNMIIQDPSYLSKYVNYVYRFTTIDNDGLVDESYIEPSFENFRVMGNFDTDNSNIVNFYLSLYAQVFIEQKDISIVLVDRVYFDKRTPEVAFDDVYTRIMALGRNVSSRISRTLVILFFDRSSLDDEVDEFSGNGIEIYCDFGSGMDIISVIDTSDWNYMSSKVLGIEPDNFDFWSVLLGRCLDVEVNVVSP